MRMNQEWYMGGSEGSVEGLRVEMREGGGTEEEPKTERGVLVETKRDWVMS